MKADMNIN